MKPITAATLCLSGFVFLFSSAAFCADAEIKNTQPTTEEAKKSSLFQTMREQDRNFFEQAFNQCNLEYLEKAIAKDFRMYHDKGGPQDRAQFLHNVKQNICANPNKKPIRKLEENSLQLFPLYNDNQLYGAIQTGIHHFYIRESNKSDVHTGTANFTHIYLLENGQWILKEALSYDHTAARKIETKAR
ncbi:hypothetical protein GCM10011613_00460 [Cellvibrio zantedeschiae]|uniref:DUF4440 domain-containing protein n=1 Tax=Cellvibrio zantedeschiae TaxID=1237077 RepID=A0ABQ3AP21_9GAMM|nr:nuclear transport factor 2 family protein [Cellvibrio zantedeschiae]GGY61027.1 hypothetical protein GCM10011613_00460 [Cellvibrio zantedeschiae]